MISDWKVIYTHPRAEKKVAEECKALGLECYLPLRSETRIYQRRKVTFLTPLFPGYVFAAIRPEQKNALLSRGHVARFIPVSRPGKMLRQLVMVRRALGSDPGLESVDPVTEGEVVRVASGAMQGCEGVVMRVRRKVGKVVLCVVIDIIGRAVPIEVEQALVERMYDPRTKTYRHVEAKSRF